MMAGSSGNRSRANNPGNRRDSEEIHFYLEHSMIEQARAGWRNAKTLTAIPRLLDPLRSAIASASQTPHEPEPEIAEINADELPISTLRLERRNRVAMLCQAPPLFNSSEFPVRNTST